MSLPARAVKSNVGRVGGTVLAAFALVCGAIGSIGAWHTQDIIEVIFKTVQRPCPKAGHVPPTRSNYPCEKSLNATHGFLCMSDKSWALKKDVFDRQERNQVQHRSDKQFRRNMGVWFQSNYEPNFSCGLERRIGRPGDGGALILLWPAPVFQLTVSNDGFYFRADLFSGSHIHSFGRTFVFSLCRKVDVQSTSDFGGSEKEEEEMCRV